MMKLGFYVALMVFIVTTNSFVSRDVLLQEPKKILQSFCAGSSNYQKITDKQRRYLQEYGLDNSTGLVKSYNAYTRNGCSLVVSGKLVKTGNHVRKHHDRNSRRSDG